MAFQKVDKNGAYSAAVEIIFGSLSQDFFTAEANHPVVDTTSTKTWAFSSTRVLSRQGVRILLTSLSLSLSC